MSKQKQPYIPFYIGDYIKDTRKLPLSVRGAWVDLLLFMWDEEQRGEIVGTMDEFAGILSCSTSEAEFVVGLLIEKKVCNHEKINGSKIKIISRRMKKDHEISLKRSESGKKSAESKQNTQQNFNKTSTNEPTKIKQNPEYEYKDDNEIKVTSLEGAGNFSFDKNTKLSVTTLEAAEMNQFTHTKNKNTDFVKSQWRIFLTERSNDPPKRWQSISELNKYFLNFLRDKFPKNGTAYQRNNSENGLSKETIEPSGSFGKL